jgi:hypothetical protein
MTQITDDTPNRGVGYDTIGPTDPMNRRFAFQKARRCHATSKRTKKRCGAPAVKGWEVCRFHGARGGGPTGKRNGAYRTGAYTKEAIEARRQVAVLIRESRELSQRIVAAPSITLPDT